MQEAQRKKYNNGQASHTLMDFADRTDSRNRSPMLRTDNPSVEMYDGKTNRELLDTYTNFFNTLFEETQMFDVDEIIRSFQKAEKEKQRVSSEIGETSKEIEELEQSIAKEKKKMAEMKQLSPEEIHKLNEATALESEIRKNDELIKAYERKMEGIGRNLGAFRVVFIDRGWATSDLGLVRDRPRQ